MDPVARQRISPNRVALILGLLLAAWLVFQFYPRKKPAPSMAPVVVTESKLRAVGLADNPDWEGLPEFFAIWAGQAEWREGKTRFAYWHPVMKTYSYYFEATREGTGFRLKEIAEPHDPDQVLEEALDGAGPIRFYRSVPRSAPMMPERMPLDPAEVGGSPKVKVDIPLPKIPLPETKRIPAKP